MSRSLRSNGWCRLADSNPWHVMEFNFDRSRWIQEKFDFRIFSGSTNSGFQWATTFSAERWGCVRLGNLDLDFKIQSLKFSIKREIQIGSVSVHVRDRGTWEQFFKYFFRFFRKKRKKVQGQIQFVDVEGRFRFRILLRIRNLVSRYRLNLNLPNERTPNV